jgi:hypothetical protein
MFFSIHVSVLKKDGRGGTVGENRLRLAVRRIPPVKEFMFTSPFFRHLN